MSRNVKRRWAQYNASLVKRGSITFWIDKDLFHSPDFHEATKGRPKFKTNIIQAGWLMRIVYKLTFRGLEGFFQSLIALAGGRQKVPSYTLFCKRGQEVKHLLPRLSTRRPLEIVIDSSGIKIYGEGEWKTYKHGREHRRRWLKIHAMIDPQSGESLGIEITDETGSDPAQLEGLLTACPYTVQRAYADGAYDTRSCRELLHTRGIEDVIPPRKTGVIREEKALKNRNDYLKEIRGLGKDYDLWKKLKGYGRRSLAETYFSRLKMVFGERLSSRGRGNQELEIMLKSHALNKMARQM